jgi:hypothetical protein
VSELSSEQEQLTEEIRDIEEKIHRHRSYGIGNASQGEFQSRRIQLEEIMNDIDRT